MFASCELSSTSSVSVLLVQFVRFRGGPLPQTLQSRERERASTRDIRVNCVYAQPLRLIMAFSGNGEEFTLQAFLAGLRGLHRPSSANGAR